MLYPDFLQHYRWDAGQKRWHRRRNVQAAPTIGSVVSLTPGHGDVFYLRVPLHHVFRRSGRSDLKAPTTRAKTKKTNAKNVAEATIRQPAGGGTIRPPGTPERYDMKSSFLSRARPEAGGGTKGDTTRDAPK